jgi:hypothetical protein
MHARVCLFPSLTAAGATADSPLLNEKRASAQRRHAQLLEEHAPQRLRSPNHTQRAPSLRFAAKPRSIERKCHPVRDHVLPP